MISKKDKNQIRVIRHQRVREKVSGTAERPRLCVYRSLKHIYVQVIDDTCGNTLVSASTMDKALAAQLNEVDKKGAAKLVGKLAAERCKEKGIDEVVFDRGGYIYTGRVEQVAIGAREAGLNF
ncbi:MAG: 50S ribosomal protein L18 [Clostridiales bacterium]|nr:50S ribosomal protein L18 [Clostridiales bacterium]MBQ2816843.1 50S ribosomal protein L18 [Clostridia bacterium]